MKINMTQSYGIVRDGTCGGIWTPLLNLQLQFSLFPRLPTRCSFHGWPPPQCYSTAHQRSPLHTHQSQRDQSPTVFTDKFLSANFFSSEGWAYLMVTDSSASSLQWQRSGTIWLFFFNGCPGCGYGETAEKSPAVTVCPHRHRVAKDQVSLDCLALSFLLPSHPLALLSWREWEL